MRPVRSHHFRQYRREHTRGVLVGVEQHQNQRSVTGNELTKIQRGEINGVQQLLGSYEFRARDSNRPQDIRVLAAEKLAPDSCDQRPDGGLLLPVTLHDGSDVDAAHCEVAAGCSWSILNKSPGV